MADAKIELVEYQAQWPQLFEQEKHFLQQVLRDYIYGGVEHVGSTAVPGLTAKPVIDIMLGVESLAASGKAIELLTRQGYCYYPYKPEQMHWFCKPSPALRTHHLHLIPYQGELWHARLAFRNALRQNCELADQYAQMKLNLAQQFRDDREAYTQAKGDFIQQVLAQYR